VICGAIARIVLQITKKTSTTADAEVLFDLHSIGITIYNGLERGRRGALQGSLNQGEGDPMARIRFEIRAGSKEKTQHPTVSSIMSIQIANEQVESSDACQLFRQTAVLALRDNGFPHRI
jgi:hypothetical protein